MLPAAPVEETRVHAVQVRGEQRRLVATGAWSNLYDRRPVVQRIRWDEHRLEVALDVGYCGVDAFDFRARFGGQLGVVNDNELARLRELVIEFLQSLCERYDSRESLVLPSERCEKPGIAKGLRIEQLLFDLGRARQRISESIAKAQFVFPYFCRKRSTRPAVSTSFCFPVKKGWQTLQMSVWISATVERVWNVLPHAHFTVAVAYSGWISAFIERLSSL